MTRSEFKNYLIENSKASERYYANRVCYELVTLIDGWIGIFEHNELTSEYYPLIQARDMNHAKDYCVMREKITVPFNVL